MSGSPTTLVTPEGIRDGEPASLEGLCRRRAGSVLDYGLAVTTPERAMEATAEAFARFRGAVIAADDPRSLNPETLLLGCTRHAAGALVAPAGDQQDCPEIPMLIVDRLDGVISPHDVPRLGSHLIHCPACRRLDAAFHEAERAYREPHRPELPADVEQRVLAALRAAAPVTWRGDGEDSAVAEASPAVDVTAPAETEPAAPEPVVELPPVEAAAEPVERAYEPEAPVEHEAPPAAEPDVGLVSEPEPEPEPELAPEPEPDAAAPSLDERADAAGTPAEDDDALPFADGDDDWPSAVPDEDEARDEPVTAVVPIVVRDAPEEDAPGRAAPAATVTARSAARSLPSGLVPRIVVPATIVALGATAAMAYAGVFGGREAAPARGTTGIPAPEPPAMPVPASEIEQKRAAEAARAALESTRERERRLAAERSEAEREDEPDTEEDGTSPPSSASPGASSTPAPTDEGSSDAEPQPRESSDSSSTDGSGGDTADEAADVGSEAAPETTAGTPEQDAPVATDAPPAP